MFDRLKSIGSRLRKTSVIRLGKKRLRPIHSNPIIVLGNQKAGTSVITHLLADYGGLSKTVDIPESWWPTLEKLINRQISLEQFAHKNRHRFSCGVIKEPNLTFFYDELRDLFPSAQFVFVVRDPRSNIRSILDRLEIAGDLSALNAHRIPETWKHVFDAELWGFDHSHYIDVLAERWTEAAKVYLEHDSHVHLIRFENFQNDKVGAIEDLAQRLSIPQKSDIRHKVNIQYQPRGDRDVTWEGVFGDANLRRIETICQPAMSQFRYSMRLLADDYG